MRLILSSKKRSLSGLCSSRRRECSIDTLFKSFSQKSKDFVQCDITISRIKSFELKNHFPQLISCQHRPFFDNSAGVSPLKIQLRQRRWKVSWENNFVECVSLQENKDFLIVVQGFFGSKKEKIFCPSPHKKVCLPFWKKYFHLKTFPWMRRLNHWEPVGKNLPKNWKGFTQSPVTFEKQKLFRKISCSLLFPVQCGVSNHAEMFELMSEIFSSTCQNCFRNQTTSN